MNANKLPIGHWIRQLDTLLSKGIDDIHCTLGINRIDWQVLHCIHKSERMDPKDLTVLMRPFIDVKALNTLLERFKKDKWISEDSGLLQLTDKGLEMHKHCYTQQSEFRQKAMVGISDREYDQTISTLEKIAANLSKSA